MKRKSRKKNLKWLNVLMGCLLIVVAIVAILMFFMQGQSNFTQSDGETEKVISLVCEGDNINYPIFDSDKDDKIEENEKSDKDNVSTSNSDNRKDKNEKKTSELKINMVMDGDMLNTISFVYKQFFDNKNAAENATVRNEAAMGEAFSADKLSLDTFSRNQSNLGDASQLSLYAERRQLSSQTAKYFMLEDAAGSYRKDSLTKVYKSKGLKCTENK